MSRISAEFVELEAEHGFREQYRDVVVGDTRFAFALAAVLCMLLVIGDFLALGLSNEFFALLQSRLLASLLCLAVIAVARRHWRWLVDGTIPTLIQLFGLVGFMSVTFLRPFEPGWHGMSMMLILFGIYVLVPNRFLVALTLALGATLVFLIILDLAFELAVREWVIFFILLGMSNVIGARVAYQRSLSARRDYLAKQRFLQTQELLQFEIDTRQRLEDERLAMMQNVALEGTVTEQVFQSMLAHEIDQHHDSTELSVLMLEIDYIKQVNITYGHQHHEQVLKHVISICQHVLRQSDSITWLGDGKFAVLLPKTNARVARALAGQLQVDMYHSPVRLPDVAFFISVSMGVAQWYSSESSEVFLKRVHDALAEARLKGGGRLCMAPASPLPTRFTRLDGGAVKPDRAKPGWLTQPPGRLSDLV